MPYSVRAYSQDPTLGDVGQVLAALSNTSSRAGSYTHVDAAVAFASARGVSMMCGALASDGNWQEASKRFLIGIDFGVTEPKALAALSDLPNAEVRIPSGRAVLRSRALKPPTTFHPKSFLFRNCSMEAGSGFVAGSANLTANGLAAGCEAVVSHLWTGSLSRLDRRHLRTAAAFLDWFEARWLTADPLEELLSAYEKRHGELPTKVLKLEERTSAARAYSQASADHEVVGDVALQMTNAKALWVSTDELYHNRGKAKPGNQLDLPRGTRVFFGFDSAKVDKNHIFGNVSIAIDGFSDVERSVRFGNNEMDKVNLPIPEQIGLDDYDHSFLIFERIGCSEGGLSRFSLMVTNRSGLQKIIRMASNDVKLTMASGREYGLLF